MKQTFRMLASAVVTALLSAPPQSQAQGPAAASVVPRVQPVELIVAAPPDVAFSRVLAGFLAVGYTVDAADRAAGTIRSLPVSGPTATGGFLAVAQSRNDFTYRATILPADSGSRVVLILTRRSVTSVNGGQPEIGPDGPLTCDGARGRAMDRCAVALVEPQATLTALAKAIERSEP